LLVSHSYIFCFYTCFVFFFFFFFFSSRRRHTRCLSDWSSDVCSSDLCFAFLCLASRARPRRISTSWEGEATASWWGRKEGAGMEIGRASCRERVEMGGVGG